MINTTLNLTSLANQLVKDGLLGVEENDNAIIEFVDNLIHDAILKNVSDIHIEPYEEHCRIRFRSNGLLYTATTITVSLALRVSTRLKIMANLNIAERRLPQDGRIQLRHPHKIDIRINTCPTLFGEKMVLRILNPSNVTLDIDELGLTIEQKKLFLSKLVQPQGLILVTGPTGSGKTITLYSALHYLNNIEKNISTVEDPVEIEFHGINQVNINPKIGLNFDTVLRTFLRQDPDIIMVGEIRDVDTATIAMQAAQTGHLVLSTVHTNNAIETIIRLQSMGIATHQLIHSISLIIAQRLIRKLCDVCKQADTSTSRIVYRAHGCDRCHQGYEGRIGIFELIPMTQHLIELILLKSSYSNLYEQVKKENILLLWEAGMEKVYDGTTSLDEIRRVIG